MRRRTGFDNIIVFLQFEVFEQYVGLEAEVAFSFSCRQISNVSLKPEKARNVKKDFGYLIIDIDDHDSVKFFSEQGCTASIPGTFEAEFSIKFLFSPKLQAAHTLGQRQQMQARSRDIFLSNSKSRENSLQGKSSTR